MTCPQCRASMAERTFGHVTVHRCVECDGVYLARANLGALIEAETDWHAHRSANTAQLPRITGDTPPPPSTRQNRAYVESLFTG